MPILAQEPSLYPKTLFDAIHDLLPGRRWWVLYTKARQEKAVARDLVGHKIPFYLPIEKKISIRRGRRVTSLVPPFPGYVFLFGSEEERVKALTTNRISRVLVVHDQEQLERDLRQVERLIASGKPLCIERRLVPGSWVRVRVGPLEGMEGTVLRRCGQTRLVVGVHFLQQGASVEVHEYMLEPIDEPRRESSDTRSGLGRPA